MDVITIKKGELQEREFYAADPIMQQMQHQYRSVYEDGYNQARKDAGLDPIVSPWQDEPVGWRKAWLGSKARAWLVDNGLLSGKESWR